jgi:transglutaminase-like putative cysteine protease
MRRHVSAHLELDVHAPTELVLQVATAATHETDERLDVSLAGTPLLPTELSGRHGTRLQLIRSDAGRLTLDYAATVTGRADSVPHDEIDRIVYLRPSRYCESDKLAATAVREFGGLSDPRALLDAVSSWVGTRLSYVPGSSGPTDGAVDTLLAGRGVCRDYAHLVVALLRALDVPARLASVYAQGLEPMDFHAVAEAYIGDGWHVVDATLLAPRDALVRISTGLDATDTAFLSNYGGGIDLLEMSVTAVVDPALPADDPRQLLSLR